MVKHNNQYATRGRPRGSTKAKATAGKANSNAKHYGDFVQEKVPKKEPKPPKQPPTALQLYIKERSSNMRSANTGMLANDVSAIAQNEWSGLTADERQTWVIQEEVANAKYVKQIERYNKKKEKYDQFHEDSDGMDNGRVLKKGKVVHDDGKKKKKKKEKDPNMPKKGLNPYMFFSQSKVREIRASDPLVQQKVALRQASALWSGMTEKEKQPFVEMAAKDKERHKVELEAYLLSKGESVAPCPAKPPKKGLNPFMFYSQARVREIRAADPMVQQKDALRQASEQWKAMSEEEKKPYLEMAAKDKVRHKDELVEFLTKQRLKE